MQVQVGDVAAELARLGFDTMGSQTPITPVLFGEPEAAFEASRRLLDEAGVWDALPLSAPVYHGKYARNEIYALLPRFAPKFDSIPQTASTISRGTP